MTLTAARLRDFLNAGTESAPDDEMTSCVASARSLLDRYIADVDPDDAIPDDLDERAHLLVAAELFYLGSSPHGYVNEAYGDGSGTPAPAGTSDPLRPARKLLALYVEPVVFG